MMQTYFIYASYKTEADFYQENNQIQVRIPHRYHILLVIQL